jgi:hypothetical protein
VKPRGPCKRYTAHQIGKLYDIVIEEGKTAKEAAPLVMVSTSEQLNTTSRNIMMMRKDACLSPLGNLELYAKLG